MVYRIFTITSGKVHAGARVTGLPLKGAGITIPAVIVGEEGRGRSRGVVVLDRAPTENRIMLAELTTTRSGGPKLIVSASSSSPSTEAAIFVLRTQMGFRGSNEHVGDCLGWTCSGCPAGNQDHGRAGVIEPLGVEDGEAPTCSFCGMTGKIARRWAEFPGKTLARGVIAEGAAGRAGSGDQLIQLIPSGVWFRTAYFGRLYGGPGSHHYRWDGGSTVTAMTGVERQLAEQAGVI